MDGENRYILILYCSILKLTHIRAYGGIYGASLLLVAVGAKKPEHINLALQAGKLGKRSVLYIIVYTNTVSKV